MSALTSHSGIVVGVDGSPASNRAVDWAARDAAMRNVRLTILHSIKPIGLALPKISKPTTFARWRVELGEAIIEDAVKIARQSTADSGPTRIESGVLFAP